MLPLVCLSVSACDVELDVFADQYWFNNKLRPDLQALEHNQTFLDEDPRTLFEPLHISNGGPSGDEIVSDISLTRTGEFASEPLHNAACLWLAPADEMKIHWETTTHITYIGDDNITLDPLRDVTGMCTFSHPYTREWVADDQGNEYPYEDQGVEPHATVKVKRRAMPDFGPFFNEYDDCVEPIAPMEDAQSSVGCSGAFGVFHSCHPEGCAFDVEADTQYQLSNVVDGTTMNVKTLEPTLKRVSGTRQLVRPLRHDAAAHEFAWGVREFAGGRWTENFSTNLRITSVRVFGLLPSGQRVYLDPDWGRIGSIPCPTVTAADDFSLRCNGVDPSTLAVNPAYFHLSSDQRISWGVSFNDDPTGAGTTTSCCEGTQEQCCDGGECLPMCSENETAAYDRLQRDLFIEFTLVDLEHLAPDLFSSPRALDFGPVEWGSSWQQEVSIKNTGGTSLQIDTVEIDSRSPGAFEVRLPANITLPKTLAADQHFKVTVLARSDQHSSEPEGDLSILARAPDGTPVQSTTALRYTPYSGPLAYTMFGNINVTGGDMHFCEDAWKQAVLIENPGDRDLIRGAYEVVGDDAASFSIEPGFPYDTLDAATRPPGWSDVVRVTFTPDPQGNYEQTAELVATANARNTPDGDIRIPLVGFLDTSDNQPGCYPWAVRNE